MRAPVGVIALATVVAVLTTGSCTNDDDPDADPTSTAPTTSAVETAPPTTSRATFCAAAARLIVSNRGIDALGTDSTAEEVRAAFIALRADYDQLEDSAPDEIGADMAAIAEAYEGVLAVVEAAGYDLGALDPEAYATARDRYLTASTQVEAYLAATCPTPPTSAAPDGQRPEQVVPTTGDAGLDDVRGQLVAATVEG